MRARARFLHLVATGLWFWIGVGQALSAAEEFIEWTSAEGTTIKAKFVDERDGKLTLVKEDGERLVLQLNQLDEASQKRAREFSIAPEEEEIEEDAESEAGIEYKVQTFEDGQWKGFHAVYDREKFVAVVEKAGRVRIYMKSGGKRIKGGPPCLLKLGLRYKNSADKDPQITSITSKAAPSTDPEKLTFSGKTDAGATFEVSYEFKDNTIVTYGTLRDRGSGASLLLGMSHPKTKNIGSSLPGDSWVKAVTVDGTEVEFDFTTSMRLSENKRIRNGVSSVTIKSEKSGPHLIHCIAPDPKHGRLIIRNVSEGPLNEGFSVPLYRSDPSERSSRAGLTVEIK